ncbi:MAG: hypothetical protein U0996_25545 [Planctomycetaceae bacterium]
MSTSPRSPKLIKGGIVLMDSSSGAVLRVIALQYNPHSLTRSLQAQWYEPQQGGDKGERLRIKGPPVETIKLEAEIDATDGLEHPDQNQNTAQFGIQPQLAALETLVYPTSGQLNANNSPAAGTGDRPDGGSCSSPVRVEQTTHRAGRITDFSITEEFFDTSLNPIQADVSLGLRVLTVDDLGFQHRGGQFLCTITNAKKSCLRCLVSENWDRLESKGCLYESLSVRLPCRRIFEPPRSLRTVATPGWRF